LGAICTQIIGVVPANAGTHTAESIGCDR